MIFGIINILVAAIAFVLWFTIGIDEHITQYLLGWCIGATFSKGLIDIREG